MSERDSAISPPSSQEATDPRIGEILHDMLCAVSIKRCDEYGCAHGVASSMPKEWRCHACAAYDALSALQQRVSDWRAWAQFVYGNGGPVPDVSDDAMRETVCRAHDAQVQALQQRVEQAEQKEATIASLLETLGLRSPWPVTEVLRRLASVAFHAREAHDCDHVGHEGDRYAAIEARRLADGIEAALASPSSPVSPREEER